MPKLTIEAEEEVLRWARVKASEENTSVARLVGRLLKERMLVEQFYDSAKHRFLGTRTRVLSNGPYPSRDDVHDRSTDLEG